MRITVLCVGKIKEKYFTSGILEYVKRLNNYCKLEIIEVSDEKTPEHASGLQELQIKQREGERLKKYIKEESYVIDLAIEGKQFDSIELAHKINKLGVDGISHITFIIGGSLGLDKTILDSADLKLSFSKMTFPHQMMRMILLEQIYRAYRINNNHPYHK
jgi:23S rRNA (pseudouridine1915-N3)-methyltransferase